MVMQDIDLELYIYHGCYCMRLPQTIVLLLFHIGEGENMS